MRVVNLSTRRVVRTFGDLLGANGTSFGPGGSRIAVSAKFPHTQGGTTGEVILLDLENGRRILHDRRTGQQVEDVAWSPDGDLVAAGADNILKIWDAETGELLHSLFGHTAQITSLDWWQDPSRPCWSPALKTAL